MARRIVRKTTRRRFSGVRRGPRGCKLCSDKVKEVNYKDTDLLQRYITEHGKIVPSRISGNHADLEGVESPNQPVRRRVLLP